jgi:hypothetical protein
MLGLSQAMIDIGTGHVESMGPEWFLSFDHGFDMRDLGGATGIFTKGAIECRFMANSNDSIGIRDVL